jgi:hypothetical protein
MVVSGDEMVDVNGGGAVDVSGGEHGQRNGDGRYAFSCLTDYGGVWQSVDTPPGHVLTGSDRISTHPLHLGEHSPSLTRRMSPTRVPAWTKALRSLPLPGVYEVIAVVDADQGIRQRCRYCGSQARL